jgi:hypothetical protein
MGCPRAAICRYRRIVPFGVLGSRIYTDFARYGLAVLSVAVMLDLSAAAGG